MPKNVITVKFSLEVSLESYRWTLKPKNSHSLAIFSSTVRLRQVIFSPVDLQMGVHVHVREVSASRFKCRILVEKLPEQQFSVCL